MSARARVYADLKTSNFTILAQLKHTQTKTKTNQIKTKRKNIAIDRMHNTQKNRIFFTWFFCNTMWMTWVCIFRRVECVCVIFLFVFLFLSFSSTACTASTEFHILIAFVVDKKFIPIFFLNNYTRKTTQKSGLRLCIFFCIDSHSLSVVCCLYRRRSLDEILIWCFEQQRARDVCAVCVKNVHAYTEHHNMIHQKHTNESKQNETKRHTNEQAKVVSVLCVCAR